MRWKLQQALAIMRLTVQESIRQPVFLLLMTAVVAFIALLPLISAFTLGEAQRMVRDSALALMLVAGLVLGCFTACTTLKHEIERGTVAAILSKPVGRGLFFGAKFAGVALVMTLFATGATAATLLSTLAATYDFQLNAWAAIPLLIALPAAYIFAGLVNYFTGRPFVSLAFVALLTALGLALGAAGLVNEQGQWVRWGSLLPWQILPAGVLILMAVLVLSAVAVGLATRLDTVPTLSLCSLLGLLGLMSDYLFGRLAATSRVAAVCYALTPNMQQFWLTDALVGDGRIPWSYVARAGLYAGCYLAGALGLGLLAFQRMEVRSTG